MTLYALDDIDDAIAATRAFLWPVELRRWAKLALVVFFLGGVGGFNPFQYSQGTPTTGGSGGFPTDPGSAFDVGPEVWAIVALVVAVAVLVGLLFMLVGSIMEFVFVESLRREAVAIRRYWGRHWGRGLRLFGFRLVVGLLTLAIVGGGILLALAPVLFGGGEPTVAAILLAVLLFLVVAIVGGLVSGFTTVFVVPVMIAEECGVLAGWRRLWPTLTDQWKQYAAYAVMGFVLQLAAGLVLGILALLGGIVLAIPFVVVGLLGAGLVSVSGTAGWVVIGLVVAVYVVVLIVAIALLSVPIQTFLRYYALLVLGDTAAEFDLVADRRRAIRGADAA